MRFLLVLSAALIAPAQLIDPIFSNPADWLSHDRDNTGQRYSPLRQIDTANVKRLTAAWAFQTPRLPLRSTFR